MAINPLGGAGPSGLFGSSSHARFSTPTARLETSPISVKSVAVVSHASAAPAATVTAAATATKMLNEVNCAQAKMNEVLKLAESGKTFSAAELLSLQTRVYRASQELDLAGKVVEKATGGVKQVLQTQV